MHRGRNMADDFALSDIKKIAGGEELLAGNFGIEVEGLRVTHNGKLSLRPHPSIFGNKLTNPYITTDFSESQVEIITPTFESIDEAFDFFSFMSDLVNVSLDKDEYLWFQSLPCILPKSSDIPIARYEGDEKAQESMDYRKGLAKKYGLRKQLISGIHFNFSFSEDFIQKLYDNSCSGKSFKDFKDNLYLKVTRNYLRHLWLIVYLTGASVACHNTFNHECVQLMDRQGKSGSLYTSTGCSLRNSSFGYKNLKKLYPSYNSVREFTDDVQSYIDEGILSEAKELYTQIRLKPKNPPDLLNSLNEDGVRYIEVRTLDINPFYKCGLIKKDMEFIHLLLVYCLLKDESDYVNWQKESLINEERVAVSAFDPDMRLLKDGEETTINEWGLEIIDRMRVVLEEFDIDCDGILDNMADKIRNPSITYAGQIVKLVEEKGFIRAQMRLARSNKITSNYIINQTDLIYDDKFKKYVPIALPGLKDTCATDDVFAEFRGSNLCSIEEELRKLSEEEDSSKSV